jgi:hypothetical protein
MEGQNRIVPQQITTDGDPSKAYFQVVNGKTRETIFAVMGDRIVKTKEQSDVSALSVSNNTTSVSVEKSTLAVNAAAMTVNVPYTGESLRIFATLGVTASTLTFPAEALCVSEGTASGDNLLALSGVVGDEVVISIERLSPTRMYVVAKNFKQ